MDRELEKKWFNLPVKTQTANVDSEVLRAIKLKNKCALKKSIPFTRKHRIF